MRRCFLHAATAVVVIFLPAEAIAAEVDAGSPPTAPLLVSGTVATPDGGVPIGTVTAYAWPGQLTAEPGDEFELIPLAHGLINPDGIFSLLAEPSVDLATEAAPNGGYLNLSLITRVAGSVGVPWGGGNRGVSRGSTA